MTVSEFLDRVLSRGRDSQATLKDLIQLLDEFGTEASSTVVGKIRGQLELKTTKVNNAKTNLLCYLGFHDYQRIGPDRILTNKNKFGFDSSSRLAALGRCSRCGKKSFQQVYGCRAGGRDEPMTEETYLKEFDYPEVAAEYEN